MASFNPDNISEWPRPLRFLIVLLFFVMVFYGGYHFDLVQLSQRVLAVEQQEKDLKQQLKIVYSKKVTIENEISQLPALKNVLNVWQKKLAQPKELPELLHQILKVGVTNDLQFVFFNPGAERVEGAYSSQPIKVVTVGNYHQIATFVSQIANMPTIVVVKNFTITKGNTTATASTAAPVASVPQDHLTAEFLLEVYHIDQKS
jgi:type IV pilus assembly protein PilO